MKEIPQPQVKGIELLKNGRYKATIKAMGDRAYLGCFPTYEEAVEARLKAEAIVRENFPGWEPGMNAANKSGVKGISYNKRDRLWMVHKNRHFVGSCKKLSDAKIMLERYER